MHAVAGNLVNAILDAIFIFPLGLGVSGAALATVTSEYVEAIMKSFTFFASSCYYQYIYRPRKLFAFICICSGTWRHSSSYGS